MGTWHLIRHKPFPIGGPLEPSLYLYRFWGYWALSMLQYPSRKRIYFFRWARPKKVTEGPGWLRYATAIICGIAYTFLWAWHLICVFIVFLLRLSLSLYLLYLSYLTNIFMYNSAAVCPIKNPGPKLKVFKFKMADVRRCNNLLLEAEAYRISPAGWPILPGTIP